MQAGSEEFENQLESHLREEALIDYYLGRLGDLERDTAQYHLMGCEACLILLKNVKDFFEPVGQQGQDLPEIRTAQEWRKFRGRVTVGQPSPVLSGRRPTSPLLHLRGVAAIAAVLIVALGLTAVWAIGLRREVSRLAEESQILTGKQGDEQQGLRDRIRQLEDENFRLQEQARAAEQRPAPPPESRTPELNAHIYDLFSRDAVERFSGTRETEALSIPAFAKSVVLILNEEGKQAYPHYAVELVDGKGRQIWRSGGLIRNGLGSFVITLDRSTLVRGTYHLRLYGQNGKDSRQIADYLLRVK